MAYCNSLRVSPELDLCYGESKEWIVNITSIYDFTSSSLRRPNSFYSLSIEAATCNLNSQWHDPKLIFVCSLLNFVKLR